MSTKRKHCQLDSTHLVRTPTIRVSRFVHNLYLYTQPEENQLLQSCAMIYNTVANHGRPTVQSGDTNNPTGLPTNSFDGLFDEPTGEPASKRPVLEWHNPAIDPNTLCTVNNPTHGIGAYFDSVRAGVQHNQGAKANSNNWDQQASTNPSTEQTQLLPSPHAVMPGVSHPPLTNHPSAGYLSTNYAAVHPDQTQRSAVPEPEIEMVTVEPPEPGIVATRTGKNWLDQEKHCLIGSYVGPNVQVDPLVLARYTPRRSSSVKVVPKVWYTLWNENYKATRELSAVMRESWTLVDTFQDIFSLVEYTSVRNQISFDQCKARFLLEPNLINPAIEEAKTAMVIPTQLKAPEVVLWLQNEWFDWFQARGFRTCPDTQRSSIAQPKGPPSNTSGSLRRKRSSHTVTSTASLPASLPSHAPASQPALSVQHTNRLQAPSGILVPSAALVGTQSPLAVAPRVSTATPDKAAVTSATPRIFSRHPQLPTDSGQGSIEGSSELYVHSQSKVGGNALQIPENTASLSELVRQNQRIIELFEESLENKWSTMKSAQIAESEANAARFHKELLDSATSTIERFVALAQANQFNHRTLMYDMMRDEKSTDRARLHAENYLINLSNNKSDFITLDGLVTELIKVIETRDKSAPS